MPRFITIGYGDPAGYDRTPRPVREAAHAQDARLVSEGAVMGIAGAAVQVRNPDGLGVETLDGPFMSSALPVAGFAAGIRVRAQRRDWQNHLPVSDPLEG